jgi:hypothetical protein
VGHLLAGILARGGKSLPFPVELLRAGSAPPVLLRNWNLLSPVLGAYALELTPDNKALIVAGGAWQRLRRSAFACERERF